MGIVMASRRGAAMKRCAVCHEPYEDDYDGCPRCVRGMRNDLYKIRGSVGYMFAIMLIGFVIGVLSVILAS